MCRMSKAVQGYPSNLAAAALNLLSGPMSRLLWIEAGRSFSKADLATSTGEYSPSQQSATPANDLQIQEEPPDQSTRSPPYSPLRRHLLLAYPHQKPSISERKGLFFPIVSSSYCHQQCHHLWTCYIPCLLNY